ncbi:MAG: ATP-binding cassette domain-containing protein [Thermaerobacter sp.]|nr:ATP-binding cassette domain-containing protein [Thermaerobacter sp.]
MLSARDALVRREQFALSGDFYVPAGELHALVGRNGAGKTTWLLLLAGRIDPSAGEVLCSGAPVRPPRVAYLPARAEDAVLGARRLLEVELTLGVQGDMQDPGKRLEALERQLDLPLERTGGHGELFMRALLGLMAMEPYALLLDEPTSRLGPTARRSVYRALTRLRDAGLAVVTATHDPELARLADRLWLVDAGTIREVSLEGAVACGAMRAPEIGGAFLGSVPLDADASGALRRILRP